MMKVNVALAVTAAATVSAQSYSTSIYTDCTKLPDATLTTYNTETVTYCSECQGGTQPTRGYAHTTIWTTVMVDFCPTGLTASTVTITESCTDATPTWSPGHSNYVPQGYTTSEMTCTVCGKVPITRVMTYPSGSPPAYPPAGAANPTLAPETAPAMAPGAGSCPGPECKAPYPTPAPAPAPQPVGTPGSTAAPGSPAPPAGCTGAGCALPVSGSSTMPAPAGNTTNITPYRAAASNTSAYLSSMLAFLVVVVLGLIVI